MVYNRTLQQTTCNSKGATFPTVDNMEMDDNVQKALELIHAADLSPPEHKLLSFFVSSSVDPKATAIYVIQRVLGDSETDQYAVLDSRIRLLLADWKELAGRCRF